TERPSTRAASCSVSFPAPNRATASHRFHCHSAISSIPLHGREGGQNRWPLEGGQNRCPSTQPDFPLDAGPAPGRCSLLTQGEPAMKGSGIRPCESFSPIGSSYPQPRSV